jgi:hypothetical protein
MFFRQAAASIYRAALLFFSSLQEFLNYSIIDFSGTAAYFCSTFKNCTSSFYSSSYYPLFGILNVKPINPNITPIIPVPI